MKDVTIKVPFIVSFEPLDLEILNFMNGVTIFIFPPPSSILDE